MVLVSVLALLQVAAPVQETPVTSPTPPESEQTGLVDSLVVKATRGKANGPAQPELTLDASEIQATGASTIQDLVALLAAEITTGEPDAPPPIYLANGRRISGFSEISGLPSQAIERMDVLPPATALAYGYRPNQRVVNFVLRKRFRSAAVELEENATTADGRTAERFDGDVFRLAGDERTTVGLDWRQESTLFEAERDIYRVPSAAAPYGLVGNVASTTFGNAIDPTLSALAGGPVTVAGAPDAAWNGPVSLAGFAAGAGDPELSGITANRSLLPSLGQGNFKAAITRDLARQVAVTVSLDLEDARRTSFLGLPATSVKLPAGSPFSPFANDVTVYRYLDAPWSLLRVADTVKGQLALAANGYVGDWRWSLNGTYDRNDNETTTGRGVDSAAWKAAIAARDPAVNPFGPVSRALLKVNARDVAKSRSKTAKAELVLNGDVAEIPAGRVSSTVKVGGERVEQMSDALRNGVPVRSDYDRRTVSVQGDIDVPLASRSHEVLPALGELTASVNAGYNLETFKDRLALGAGLHWSPDQLVQVNVSFSEEQSAPNANQIVDPVVLTPSVTVFDFATNQSVTVSRVEGGNSGLANDRRRTLRAGVNVKPIGRDGGPTRLTVNANWVRTHIDDPISNFPLLTPALEAAFPERFTRNADGNLTAIDSRPLNFDAIDREELRGGFNLTRFIGRPKKGAPKGAKPDLKNAGQVQLSLNYVLRLRDETTLRHGLPPLDLLNGASTSRRGQPREELNFRLNAFRQGVGVNLNGAWRGGSTIDAGPGNGALRFDDQTTVNLSAFYEVPRDVKAGPASSWLAGTRVTLAADNVFYSRPVVRDAKGATPQAYQPDYLDPLGRTVKLTLRKSLIAL
ncbi:TonB-dependent receptor [Caulobacter segnis]|uniref:TonB-dependent receptor n=1 Tax=Caulobacter segnis TaxID=88688 RepID=UPI001CBBFEFE|nr:TonB-dependent receptor [Caulobacter segnis]UAL09557.1 TonB-dependent receptor [Caulobacter segnis]